MTFSDRDLREALAPLAGDPKAVARQVLAALPPAPPPAPAQPSHRGLPWWMLLVGAAAGFALGFWLGQEAGRSKLPPVQAPPVDSRPQKRAPTGPVEIEVLAAIGRSIGYGARKETVTFADGAKAPLGTWIESNDDAQAALRIGDGVEIHFGPRVALRIESEHSIGCKEGRCWVDVHQDRPLLIDVGAAQIVARDAEFLFSTGADGPHVAVLRGSVELSQGKSGGTKVEQGQECQANAKGLMAARPTEPKTLLVLGSWQAELLRKLRRTR